jgi:hypothetical protein
MSTLRWNGEKGEGSPRIVGLINKKDGKCKKCHGTGRGEKKREDKNPFD